MPHPWAFMEGASFLGKKMYHGKECDLWAKKEKVGI